MNPKFLTLLLIVFVACTSKPTEKQPDSAVNLIELQTMDLGDIRMGWPIPPHINKTVKGTPLSVGNVVYKKGIWMNSTCTIPIVLDGRGKRFKALCGTDDITQGSYKAVMEFLVIGDLDTLWRSGAMQVGDTAKAVDVDVSAKDTLWLVLDSYDGNVGNDQGNWLNPVLSYTGSSAPYVYKDSSNIEPDLPRQQSGYQAFHPGKSWYDTDGRKIQAHGGGLLKVGDIYYWYGEEKGGETTWWPKARVDIRGVGCYSSKDLYNWKNEGILLPGVKDDTTSPLYVSNILERPKVIFNPKTKQYVLYVKSDDINYSSGHALIATSDKPTGPFSIVHRIKPDGLKFGDFNIYEIDGKGYLIWGHGHEDNKEGHAILLYELTDDFLNIKQRIATIYPDEKREAPALIKQDGYYYLFTSGKSGWSPNPTKVARSKELSGPWKDLGECFVGPESQTSFRSQPTYVLNHQGTLIYMGDRWNQRDLGDSRYVWLPISINGEQVEIKFKESWSY